MKRLLAAILLSVTGCAGGYQHQVDQSLMQENRRLENALYVTHAQLVTLKRENDVLRGKSGGSSGDSVSPAIPLLRPKRSEPVSHDDFDEAPPFAPPEINLPNSPGSDTIPDSLKGSRIIPPNKKSMSGKTKPDEIIFPAMDDPEVSSPLNWSPTR